MTDYKLPEPTPCGYISKTEFFYTEAQMQQAYQAGRDSMMAEAVKVCEYYAENSNAAKSITKSIRELK